MNKKYLSNYDEIKWDKRKAVSRIKTASQKVAYNIIKTSSLSKVL